MSVTVLRSSGTPVRVAYVRSTNVFCVWAPTFRQNLLPPFSEKKIIDFNIILSTTPCFFVIGCLDGEFVTEMSYTLLKRVRY
jgi:hypothetical protein